MIELHRLNNTPFMLNHRHIETIEATPDTVITMNNEKKYIVKEKPHEVREKIREFESGIFRQSFSESADS